MQQYREESEQVVGLNKQPMHRSIHAIFLFKQGKHVNSFDLSVLSHAQI